MFYSLICTIHYCLQANKDRQEIDVARQTSEMEQLKQDWDKSKKKYEKAFRSIIVSEQTLCGGMEGESCIIALCLDTHRIQRKNTALQTLTNKMPHHPQAHHIQI